MEGKNVANKWYATPTEIDKVRAKIETLAKEHSVSGSALDFKLGGSMT
ncbi:protein of unknown function [Serratia sp. Tan611]|nr:protein of unknown function [Serratia sp. Tan611]